jgi:hypothetical protein
MIQYADAQIMQVCGVTPEFMGMMTSKEMNSSFYRQQIQQGLTPLATYLDAKHTYLESQAGLYIDCTRVLAENSEGRLIKNVIGENNAQYVPLLKSGIAEEYDVIVEEMPTGPNENRETFASLVELQGQMLALPNPVNIMPLVMQYAPLKPDIIKQITKMLQPPPPQGPDPVNQKLLLSQAEYNSANAQKLIADAENTKLDTALKANDLKYAPAKDLTDIGYTHAKTVAELSKVHKTKHDIVSGHIGNITSIHANHNKTNERNNNESRPQSI